MMDVREGTARTVDEYVATASFLGRNKAGRIAFSAEIAEKKHRIYRDRDCIAALETFLDRAVRNTGCA
jgi:predicted O-linked N-acetylglucosamine transferase (SPINDLY family)